MYCNILNGEIKKEKTNQQPKQWFKVTVRVLSGVEMKVGIPIYMVNLLIGVWLAYKRFIEGQV